VRLAASRGCLIGILYTFIASVFIWVVVIGSELRVANFVIDMVVFMAAPIAIVGRVVRSFSGSQLQNIGPLAGFRADVRSGLTAGAVGAAVIGFSITAWMFGLSTDRAVKYLLIVIWLASPFATMTFFWLTARHSSAFSYVIAVIVLGRQGKIPIHPLRFLEDAHKRGVLRQSGMTYEFRHARFAERLKSKDGGAV
jgi:hypothetical protein